MQLWIILTFILIAGCTTSTSPTVCFNDSCFDVEIADTPEKRAVGLMQRESLADDAGMLFIFDEPSMHSFWMKNTLIPLDIIWLDENFSVVYIIADTQPCTTPVCPSIHPGHIALYVLEMGANRAQEEQIKLHDTAVFSETILE